MHNNRLVSLASCRHLRAKRKPSNSEKILELGKQRVKRDLDIRNLMKA